MFWLSAYDSDNAKHSGYLLPQSPMFIYYLHRKIVASKVDKICGKNVYSLLATYIQDDIWHICMQWRATVHISCMYRVLWSLTYWMGWNNLVTKVTCYGLDYWGLVSGRDMGFPFNHYFPGCSGHMASSPVCARRLFPLGWSGWKVKLTVCEQLMSWSTVCATFALYTSSDC